MNLPYQFTCLDSAKVPGHTAELVIGKGTGNHFGTDEKVVADLPSGAKIDQVNAKECLSTHLEVKCTSDVCFHFVRGLKRHSFMALWFRGVAGEPARSSVALGTGVPATIMPTIHGSVASEHARSEPKANSSC